MQCFSTGQQIQDTSTAAALVNRYKIYIEFQHWSTYTKYRVQALVNRYKIHIEFEHWSTDTRYTQSFSTSQQIQDTEFSTGQQIQDTCTSRVLALVNRQKIQSLALANRYKIHIVLALVNRYKIHLEFQHWPTDTSNMQSLRVINVSILRVVIYIVNQFRNIDYFTQIYEVTYHKSTCTNINHFRYSIDCEVSMAK